MKTSSHGRVVLAAVMAMMVIPAATSAAAEELTPDLGMAKLFDLRLTREDTVSGPDRRLLRFSATIINRGVGPFIVRAQRECSTDDCPEMTTEQRIRRADGSVRRVRSTATGSYDVGDGHDHWHITDIARYELIAMDMAPAEAVEAIRGSKVGFCPADTTVWNRSLPNAPDERVFYPSDCGTRSTTRIRVGLSNGWGDTYLWSLPRQWIDTTGLAAGRYLVCATADGEGQWLEGNEGNNQSWSEIELYQTASNEERVRLLAEGRGACADRLPPMPEGFWLTDLPRAEAVHFGGDATVLSTTGEPRLSGDHTIVRHAHGER